MMYLEVLLFVVNRVVAVLLLDTFTISDEKRLVKSLLARYEEYGIVGRPVYNTSIMISVDFGIGLIQILDLDERNQILTTNVWCRYVSAGRHSSYCAFYCPRRQVF